jgi:hypothetical protein
MPLGGSDRASVFLQTRKVQLWPVESCCSGSNTWRGLQLSVWFNHVKDKKLVIRHKKGVEGLRTSARFADGGNRVVGIV